MHSIASLAGILLAALMPSGLVMAQTPLPEPLTLAEALNLTSQAQPLLLEADAAQAKAQAGLLDSGALSGTRLTLKGQARLIEPSYKSSNPDANGSSASLSLRKRLYDFGYGNALRESADHAVKASEARQIQARQQVRLQVMRAYFDVILADLEFARDNEAMSIAFIRADRASDRSELGMLSDVDLLQAQADYEAVRQRRFASEARQRQTRARLAIAMGRPDDLASDLVPPQIDLPAPDPQADFDVFWHQVETSNPELIALRAAREGARKQVAAARAKYGPVLTGTADAAVYNRATGSTDPLSAGVLLEIPLLTGGRKDADMARAQAAVSRADAALLSRQFALRDQALSLWLERQSLRASIQALHKRTDYRDLYLDRSRALYELEVKTDLGDAMTQTTDVRLKLSEALFALAMNTAQRKALTGQLLE